MENLKDLKLKIIDMEKQAGLYYSSEISNNFDSYSYRDLWTYYQNLKDEYRFQTTVTFNIK